MTDRDKSSSEKLNQEPPKTPIPDNSKEGMPKEQGGTTRPVHDDASDATIRKQFGR